MDERELVGRVLAAVDEAAYHNAATKVTTVHLAIGWRRTFDLDRLREVFAVAARGTVAEGARLSVKVLPVGHHCRNCGNDFEGSRADAPCPECGQPHTDMIGGEELRLLEMEIADVA